MLSVIKTAIITIIISFISGVLLDNYKNLSVKIDYISIVFDTATAEDVIMHILGLPTDIFNVICGYFLLLRGDSKADLFKGR